LLTAFSVFDCADSRACYRARFVQSVKPEFNFMDHYNSTERQIARELIRSILGHPDQLRISVYDGEEYTVKRSRDSTAILGALSTTDSDVLVIRDSANTRLGSILLIGGNDGDLIADHTDSPLICALIADANRNADLLLSIRF
jgi:hypothetical protein